MLIILPSTTIGVSAIKLDIANSGPAAPPPDPEFWPEPPLRAFSVLFALAWLPVSEFSICIDSVAFQSFNHINHVKFS